MYVSLSLSIYIYIYIHKYIGTYICSVRGVFLAQRTRCPRARQEYIYIYIYIHYTYIHYTVGPPPAQTVDVRVGGTLRVEQEDVVCNTRCPSQLAPCLVPVHEVAVGDWWHDGILCASRR